MDHFPWSWIEGKEDMLNLHSLLTHRAIEVRAQDTFIEVFLFNSGYAHSPLLEGTF